MRRGVKSFPDRLLLFVKSFKPPRSPRAVAVRLGPAAAIVGWELSLCPRPRVACLHRFLPGKASNDLRLS